MQPRTLDVEDRRCAARAKPASADVVTGDSNAMVRATVVFVRGAQRKRGPRDVPRPDDRRLFERIGSGCCLGSQQGASWTSRSE